MAKEDNDQPQTRVSKYDRLLSLFGSAEPRKRIKLSADVKELVNDNLTEAEEGGDDENASGIADQAEGDQDAGDEDGGDEGTDAMAESNEEEAFIDTFSILFMWRRRSTRRTRRTTKRRKNQPRVRI